MALFSPADVEKLIVLATPLTGHGLTAVSMQNNKASPQGSICCVKKG